MLDVRRLRLLRELQIRGTLAGVAEALSFSPSAVSQQLSQLEKDVGVELLRSSGRRVVLTPEAEILVTHTAEVLRTLERAEVRVEMVQREPETALRETWARDFDLVIAEQYPGHAAPRYPELDRRTLTTDTIRLATPPADQGRLHPSAIGQASNAAWVMEPRGTASRHWAEQACRRAGFEPDVRFETADLQSHIRLVESGNALALLPDLVWIGRGTTARLVLLPEHPARTIFTSVREASSTRPAIVAVREVLDRAVRRVAGPTGAVPIV